MICSGTTYLDLRVKTFLKESFSEFIEFEFSHLKCLSLI